MAQLQKVSFLLNGGVDEQSQSELAAPIAAQGASLTLRQSLNTRLSKVPGSCVRAPWAQAADTLASRLYGLVPSVAGKNVLAIHSPGLGSEVLTEEGVGGSAIGAGPLKADILGVTQPNAWVPAQVSGAGAIPSCSSPHPPAVCADSNGDRIWSAWVRVDPETGDSFIVAAVSSYTGAILAPATTVASLSATTDHWVAVTDHNASGIRVWFKGGSQMHGITLSLAGNTITPSGLNSMSWSWDVYPAVTSGLFTNPNGTLNTTYADYAFFATDATGGFARVAKVHVNTYAQTGVNYAGYLTGFPDAAICINDVSGGAGSIALGVAFQGAGTLNVLAVHPGTLANIWADSEPQDDGTVAIQPYLYPSGAGFMVAVSPNQPFVGNTAAAVATFYKMNGTLTSVSRAAFTRLYSKGAAVRLSATELYPLFDMVGCFADSSVLPSSPEYTLDPAVVVYLATPVVVSPVARFACPRSTLSPVRIHAEQTPRQSACTLAYGDVPEVRFQWSKDVLQFSIDDDPEDVRGNADETSYPGRYTHLSFEQHQPAVVHDKSGVAFVAGALPVQWDGEQVVEAGGPLWAPHLQVQSVPGIGDTYPAGAYQFGVHFEWFDAAGLQHRSAPAIISWTSAGSKPFLTASAPTGMKDNIGRFAPVAVFFATETDGAILHRLTSIPLSGTYSIDFTNVKLANGARQPIYTTAEAGQQQPAALPPPTWDWCFVGDRIVGIDAEVRDRLFVSKRRSAGIGIEFSPFYEVLLPSGAGDAVAVREWQGTIVCFTTNAIYQISLSGGGPDNLVGNPSGGAFSAPIRVGSVGCNHRESVLVTPKGILFQRGVEMLFFTGGEPQVLPGVNFEGDVAGAFLLPNDDEAVVVLNDVCKVFNYRLNRWTTWEIFDGDSQFFVVDLPWSNDQVLLAESDTAPKVRRLDSAQLSQTAEMQWESDWLLLGGDFEDRVNLQWVVVNGRALSSHSLELKIFTNFDETDGPNTTTELWEDLTGRFSRRKDPWRKDSRAIKWRLTEADLGETRDGFRPISITLYFRVEGTSNESAYVQGAHT